MNQKDIEMCYYHGLQSARCRLHPKSPWYNPEYDFHKQAKRIFATKEEIKRFLEAIQDYKDKKIS